jgi:hypothetical protein
MKKLRNKRHTYDKGVVLLISVVIASLVLALGIGIGNIIAKEVVLTSLSKNSRVAFFAADAGIECAMHWDLIRNVAIERQLEDSVPIASIDISTYPASVFATSSASVAIIQAGSFYNLGRSMGDAEFSPFCAGQSAVNMFDNATLMSKFNRAVASDSGDPIFVTRFFFYPTGVVDDGEPCTLVRVEKEQISAVPLKYRTSIFSEGFSSCDPADVRRVSRGLRVDYSL